MNDETAELTLIEDLEDFEGGVPEPGGAHAHGDEHFAADRITELYQGEIHSSGTAEIARRRIDWICGQCIGETVLDVGCSQGISSILLARKGFRVVGLDIYAPALVYAREAAAREAQDVRERISWIESDLADFSSDMQFDTVIMGEVIEHQAKPAPFLAQAARFVRPGGRLVLTTPFGLHPHPDHKVVLLPGQLADMAVSLDLDLEQIDVIDGYMRLSVRRLEPGEKARTLDERQLLRITEKAALESQETLRHRLDRASATVAGRGRALERAVRLHAAEIARQTQERIRALAELRHAHQSEVKGLQHALNIVRSQKESLANEIGRLFTLLDYERAPAIGLLRRGVVAMKRDEGDSASRLALYLHYLWKRRRSARQLVTIAASGYFDPTFYRHNYPDVAALNIDPLIHFLDHGGREARDPSTRFDSAFYLRNNPDVAASGINPLLHFLLKGRHERRVPRRRSTLSAAASAAVKLAELKDTIEDVQEYVRTYNERGVGAVIGQMMSANSANPSEWHARRLVEIGEALTAAGHADADLVLAKEAFKLDHSEPMLGAFLSVAQSSKRFNSGIDIVRELEALIASMPAAIRELSQDALKASPTHLLYLLKLIVPKRPLAFEPVPRRLCYVLHNTLPYSSGGYGTRSHGMAVGLKEAGYDVVAVTRPGYPLDLKPELKPNDVPLVDTIDGIPYVRTLEPLRTSLSSFDYIAATATELEKRFREQRPEIVVAASNHANSLPALIAARKVGVPFVYEVRGLWEITRQSKEESFEDTSAFQVQKILEAAVAQESDHVFTLTEALKEELVERGTAAGKVTLAPNSCDPEHFMPAERDRKLAARLGIPVDVPVIGYVGTFVAYEGLEDLASACGLLKASGMEFRLLLVGNENASGLGRGRISDEISRIAKVEGFADWLIMPGRVPHNDVVAYYTLIDICPFPRKPWPVCEMVSPLKPLEALAMEKAVVVSSVRALAEMIENGVRGLVFEKGSVVALAAALARLVESPDERRRFGKSGRAWVIEKRTWRAIAQSASEQLARITRGR